MNVFNVILSVGKEYKYKAVQKWLRIAAWLTWKEKNIDTLFSSHVYLALFRAFGCIVSWSS